MFDTKVVDEPEIDDDTDESLNWKLQSKDNINEIRVERSQPKYPKINDPELIPKINKTFKQYQVPKERKSMKELCFPEKFEFQKPQKFVASYINPKTNYKSILVYHRIGAGKTCTAIQIAEVWKHKRKILIVLPASLKGSFRTELRSSCAGNNYITPEQRDELKRLHPSSIEYQEIIKKSDAKIDEYYHILSYNKFVEYAKKKQISLHNTVLIIDEIQNMISEKGIYYQTLYKIIHKAPKNLRIVLLSGTPIFDSPCELPLTINLLRPETEMPTGNEFYKTFVKIMKRKDGKLIYQPQNMELFKNIIRGYVSYYRGAPEYIFPQKRVHNVYCVMSDFQLQAYNAVLHQEKRVHKKIYEEENILDLPNDFFIGSRIVSNIVFPNKKIHESGFDSFTDKYAKKDKLMKYSMKFYRILNKIKHCHGTVFVYSGFREYGGLRSFEKVLRANGFKDYQKHGEGRNRYAVWAGGMSASYKEEIKAVFNRKENVDGSKLKVILGSPATKEGLSFYRVKQVHVMEPYWNNSRIEQIIGRAIRTCSHKDVPRDERYVDVFMYYSIHPKIKESVDMYIKKLAYKKYQLVYPFMMALKETAVDCLLNKNANEKNIVCDFS